MLEVEIEICPLIDEDNDDIVLAYFGGHERPNTIIVSVGSLTLVLGPTEALEDRMVTVLDHEILHWIFYHEKLATDDHAAEHHMVDWVLERI